MSSKAIVPSLDVSKKDASESKGVDIPETMLNEILSPQQQSNAVAQSVPLTPLDLEIVVRPSSSCPEEQTLNADNTSKGRTFEPEHIVEWSPNQRYGKVQLYGPNCDS